MTLRRHCLVAIGTASLLLGAAGCGGDEPSTPTTSPSASAVATATPSATATPTASATPTKATGNAPLECPEALTVAGATDSALVERTVDSDTACAYGVPNGKTSGSIQSEDWFHARSLKGYRIALTKPRNQIKGIRTKVVDRPDFGTGAFMVTITGGTAGAISSLVVPREGGQFASISASRVKEGQFMSDVDLTEDLARAFLDNQAP